MDFNKELIELEKKYFVKKNKISFKTREIINDDNPYINKSGGNPYIPKNFIPPKDMGLLAQINFELININLDYFPKTGILQFYSKSSEELWGCDFDFTNGKSSGYEIIYHENISEHNRNNNYQENLEEEYFNPFDNTFEFIFDNEFKNSFPSTYELIELKNLFEEIKKLGEKHKIENFDEDSIYEGLLEKYSRDDFQYSQMGGYPYFTQSDIRENLENPEDYILLFQIDSDDNIMIGDVGVMNFFIKKEELINKDFSNIIYSWDCC